MNVVHVVYAFSAVLLVFKVTTATLAVVGGLAEDAPPFWLVATLASVELALAGMTHFFIHHYGTLCGLLPHAAEYCESRRVLESHEAGGRLFRMVDRAMYSATFLALVTLVAAALTKIYNWTPQAVIVAYVVVSLDFFIEAGYFIKSLAARCT